MSASPRPAASPPVFICGRYRLVLDRPLLMGIVNVTPDSFSDGGQFFERDGKPNTQQAIAHAQRLVEDGADILDIGGESTRPGAEVISIQQELDRIMPVVERALTFGLPVSVDTRRPEVMRTVIRSGVDLINDVNGFRDPQAIDAVADATCGLCIMHMKGEPATMQANPVYDDVVREVHDFLIGQRDVMQAAGIDPRRVVVDPGFGFGKNLQHNLELMRSIERLSCIQPVLVGVSRKSMIGGITGQKIPAERIFGSVAAAIWAAAHGAAILRVHDVRETAESLKVWAALES